MSVRDSSRSLSIAAGPAAPMRLQAALQPDAPTDVLLDLALDDNLWVRRQAAAHPGFPVEELALLQRAGSSADLSSFAPPDPALSSEALRRLTERGEWGRRLAARHSATPAETLIALGDHPSAGLRADLATNPGSPAELVVRLVADSDPAVRQAALKRASSAPSGPGETATDGADPGFRVKENLNSVDRRDSSLIETLALLRAAGASADLAAIGAPSRPLAAAERAALLALGPFARQLAAGLPELELHAIEALARDADAPTRVALARNPACPAPLLIHFAEDNDPAVQKAVLGNARAPAEALIALAVDEDDTEMLVAIAAHPATPADLLARFAEHGAGRVREAAASQARFPPDHREILRRAGSSPDLLAFLDPDPALPASELTRLARSGAWGRLLAARHPATNASDLAHLAADADLLVRQTAARNPRLPAEVLDLLMRAGSTRELDGFGSLPGQRKLRDPSQGAPASAGRQLAASDLHHLADLGPWGRRLAAHHSNCPAELLADLANDPDPQTRAAVASHPHSDEPILIALAQDISPAVRWEVVKRSSLPAACLVILARDPLATIRTAVAAHHSASSEILRELARDPDEDVRTAASQATIESPPSSSTPHPSPLPARAGRGGRK